MKKILALILVLALCLSLAACGGAASSSTAASTVSSGGVAADSGGEAPAAATSYGPYKIAICEMALSDESVNRAEYFKNYISPNYNVEFMFSEACGTTEAAITFIENAADAGCDAVISYYVMDTEQLVQLCREKGMVYCVNGNRNANSESTFTGGYENFMGGFAANQQALGQLFYDYLSETLDPTEPHGFLVTSGIAYTGNEQTYEISANMLKALQDIYGLQFENTIDDLVISASPIEAKNDKGIDIYVYPGSVNLDGWLQGLSSALQTGKYDYCLYSQQTYVDSAVTIEEVEKSFNKDITVVSFGTFGDNLTNAFNTKDMFGNPTLSMSTVKFTSLVSAMAFIEVYNALTGHASVLQNAKGEAPCLLFKMQPVTSAEQLADMSNWDKGEQWVGDYGLIDSCLGINNPELTIEQIQKNIDAVTYESISARLN